MRLNLFFFLLGLGCAISKTSADFFFLEHLPYVSCQNETSASGLLPDLLELRFQSLLEDFGYSIETHCYADSADFPSVIASTSFKGPIDLSVDEADPKGSFLPLMGYSVVLIAKKTFAGADFFYYFGSFSLLVYASVVLLVFVTALHFWLCERSADQKVPLRFTEGYRMCLYHSVMMLFHLSDKNIRSIPGRIVAFVYLSTSSVIGCFFLTGVIMRMLTYPHSSEITLDHLGASSELLYQPGLEAVGTYLSSDAQLVPLHMDLEKDKKTLASLGGSQVVMADSNYLKAIGADGCDFYIIDKIPYVSQLMVQIPTSLPMLLKKQLEMAVLYDLQFSGSKIIKSYTGTQELSNCFEMDKTISTERVISIWVFFFLGVCLSFFVFVISILHRRFKWFDFLFRTVDGSKFKGRKTALKTRNKIKLLDFFDRILQQFKERHINAIKKLSGFAEAEEHKIKLFYTNFKSFFDQIKSRLN